MLIPSSGSWQPGRKKRTVRQELVIGPTSLKFITVVLLAALALFYLAQSSQSATRAYRINDLRSRAESLRSDNEQLKLDAVRLQSLQTIQDAAGKLKLESAK